MHVHTIILADIKEQQKSEVMSGKESSTVHLDSWGITTAESLEACKENTKKWKPAMIELGLQVNEAMKHYQPCPNSKLKPRWYLVDGTLLGAYRSGEMISHDYDFDFGLCFLTEDNAMAGLEESRKELKKVAKHLTESLDKKYTVACTNDYACKIEVYQESSGMHWKGNWYNVNLDLQLVYSEDQKQVETAYFRDNLNEFIKLDIINVIPLSEITFESRTWPCPNNPKEYLTSVYGYIGTPAKFNPDTRKYEPLESHES